MKRFARYNRKSILAALLCALLLVSAVSAGAYLYGRYGFRGTANIEINVMFDNFTPDALKEYQDSYQAIHGKPLPDPKKPENKVAYEWGHVGNPYVISLDRHLENLSILQNNGVLYDPNTVYNDLNRPCFVISTNTFGPTVVGGQNIQVKPVGNESCPFIGTIEGITDPQHPAILPDGTRVATSAVHNVTVSASGSEPDVGFFGKVGPGAKVQNMVFSDVKISVGNGLFDGLHTWLRDLFAKEEGKTVPDPAETNHLGIIAGHVDHATMKDLSVYYSSSDRVAIELKGNSKSNYLCGTGFFGLLDHLNPDDPNHDGGWDNDDFTGGSDGSGGTDYGKNVGFIRAEEMFKLRPAGIDENAAVELRALRENGESKVKLSADGKGYIYDGVFAFALSPAQNDTIENIWPVIETRDRRSLSRYEIMAALGMVADGTENQDPVLPPTSDSDIQWQEEPEQEEKPTKVTFHKLPRELKITIWKEENGRKELQLSHHEMEEARKTAGKSPDVKMFVIDEKTSVRQAQEDPSQPDTYLLLPGAYFYSAEMEGYTSIEQKHFTVDERADSMRIDVTLAELPEETTEATEETTEETTEPATEESTSPTEETTIPTEETTVPTEETMAPTEETTAPTEQITVPSETQPVETKPAETQAPETRPAETQAAEPPVQGENVVMVMPSSVGVNVLPGLYFGADDGIVLSSLMDVEWPGNGPAETTVPDTEKPAAPAETRPAKPEKPKTPENSWDSGNASKAPRNVRLKFSDDVPLDKVKATFYVGGEGTLIAGEPGQELGVLVYTITSAQTYVTISCEGFETLEKVDLGQWNDYKQITLTPAKPKTVTFTFLPNGVKNAQIHVWAADDTTTEIQPTGKPHVYKLFAGDYVYDVTCKGYDRIVKKPLTVSDAAEQTVSVELKKSGTAVTFQGNLPAGTEVKLYSGTDTAAAPVQSFNKVPHHCSLPAGQYTYTVICPGYQPVQKAVTIKNQAKQTIQIPALEPVPKTKLTFSFKPAVEGSPIIQVYYEGKPDQPVCTLDNTYACELYPGSYQYTVTCPGYQEITGKQLTVGESSPQTEVISMQQFKTVTLVCNPENLTLTFWPESSPSQKTVSQQESREFKLLPGTYGYTAQCPDFKDGSGSFTVGEELRQTVEIPALTALIRTKVTFQCPEGMTVQVWSGKGTDRVEYTPKQGVYHLLEGDYFYSVKQGENVIVPEEPLVVQGNEQTVTVNLSRITFTCTPEGMNLEVYRLVNGEKLMYPVLSVKGNTRVYQLPAHEDYTYSATCHGYYPSGKKALAVTEGKDQNIRLTLEEDNRVRINVTFQTDQNLSISRVWTEENGSLVEYKPVKEKYILIPGTYHYSVKRGITQVIPKETFTLAEEPVNVEIQVKTAKGQISIQPAHAAVQVWRMDGNRKVFCEPYRTNGNTLLYELRKPGEYYYTATAPGCYPKTGVAAKLTDDTNDFGTVSIQLENKPSTDSGHSIPAEGPNPSLKHVAGSKSGTDMIQLTKKWKRGPIAAEKVNGVYHIYLQKVNDISQIHVDEEGIKNSRYFICAQNYEGEDPSKMAYLGLHFSGGNGRYTVEKLQAQKLDQAEVSKSWTKPEGYTGPKPDLVMSFRDPEKRMEAIANLGLQIQRTSSSNLQIFQSVLNGNGEWVPKYFMGMAYVADQSGNDSHNNGWRRLVRSNGCNPIPELKGDPFNLTYQGSGGVWTFHDAGNQMHLRYDTSTGTQNSNFLTASYEPSNFCIYQVVGYYDELAGTEEGWVPDGEPDHLLSADEYVLWMPPQPVSDADSHATWDPFNHGSGMPEYELIKIGDLGKKGWKLRGGQTITDSNYHPNKLFNVKETALRQGISTGTGYGFATIRLPLRNDGATSDVPQGTLSYYVNREPPKTGEKTNIFVRLIAKTPLDSRPAGISENVLCRLGTWQVAGNYEENKPRAHVPMPVSQPVPQNAENHYIRVKYAGEHYHLYLQGESLLVATEFSLDNMKLKPAHDGSKNAGAFFITQTERPMQLVYCAAEGIADGDQIVSGTPGSVELGNIDFVYQSGGEVAHVKHPDYKRSGVLFYFTNLKKDGADYPDINKGMVNIWRQATGPEITWNVTDKQHMTFGITDPNAHDVLSPTPTVK